MPHQSQVLPPGARRASGDDHIFLIGRPPLIEFLGFIETRTVEGQTADRRGLMARWRTANDHIRQLQQVEAGLADGAPVKPLPAPLRTLADQLIADPAIAATYSIVPIELAMVELDRLVVFQKSINVAHVATLAEQLADEATAEDVFGFALSLEGRADPEWHAGQTAQGGWLFSSRSTDLRFLGVKLIDPRSVVGLDVPGRPTAIVAAVVGYGTNLLSAVRFDGRLVLHNGSHRAFALRAAGHSEVPCLIQNVSRREELELVAPEMMQHAELYLTDPRPPLLKDYFDERLLMRVHVPPSEHDVAVGFQVQVGDRPIS